MQETLVELVVGRGFGPVSGNGALVQQPHAGVTSMSRILLRHDWRIHHIGNSVNASLVSGLSEPEGIAVSGSNLFVVEMAPVRLANTPRRGKS